MKVALQMTRCKCVFVALSGLLPWCAQAQRLPTNVRPEHYSLAVSPDLKTASFAGSETIDVVLGAPASTITLNALELKILGVKADGQEGAISYDAAKEQATFSFARVLPAGKVSLAIAYTGVLNDKLRGFYLSKTKTRSYAVSQFESTDARRAFPSFDEPALKATFDVSLTVDEGDMAISNTNVIADRPAGTGKHTLVFARTPKMSTYLVAFLVGDFACSKGKAEGVPIRVCSTPDKVKLTKFAVAAAEHFLSYYDHYFGIKYPMPKLDLIGIPDFEAGAMENFGAITYRETELLVDEKNNSINGRKRVAEVVAHEMAHQWFGDMVTMQWWDNLWLNEGFATWMESKAANDWHPEWNFLEDVADSLESTLNYDGVLTTRTIRASAETPAQISEMFDGIAYGKAGAVIGMIENWVGPKVFQQGVHAYLSAHLYGNATAEDFWNTQTQTAHQPVDKVMASFVDRPGVPLLTFSPGQDGNFPVKQSRFYLGGASASPSETANKDGGWTIPVCVKASGSPVCSLVSQATAVVQRPAGTQFPYFYANAGTKGYYRVAYAPEQVAAITKAAETSLSVTERIGFLGDRWALTRAGENSVGAYLDLVMALKQDKSAQVLTTALETVAQVGNRIATDEDRDRLNEVVRRQFGPIYAALGKEDEHASYDQKEIRTQLFSSLGEAGEPAVLAHARQVTDDLLAGKKVTEPAIVDVSVELAAANGDASFYERMLSISQKAADPSLANEALEMLTRFRTPALVIRTLEYAVSGQVRNQDSWLLIARELSQRETRDLAWPWVQQHWAQVQAQLTTASGANVIGAAGSFCTEHGRDEVAGFFAAHPVEAADRALGKALDSITNCARLRQIQEPKLHEWLGRQAQ